MSSYNFKINETDFAVSVWLDGADSDSEPIIYQPFNPISESPKWASAEEATSWAEELIYNLENPPTSEPEQAPAE
jgi:hypothetical protein